MQEVSAEASMALASRLSSPLGSSGSMLFSSIEPIVNTCNALQSPKNLGGSECGRESCRFDKAGSAGRACNP